MKKIKSFFFVLLLLIPQIVLAQFSFYVDDIKLKPGAEGDIYITMKNGTNIQSYDFVVDLPVGFSFVFDGDVSESFSFAEGITLPQGQTLDANYNDGTGDDPNSIHVMGYSSAKLGYFVPGEYKFVKFRIKASEDVKVGNVYSINTHEIVFNSPEYDTFEPEPFISKITVYQTYSISAVSADETMGSVTLTNGGEAVENGTNVVATATPVAGYDFVNWVNEDGSEVSKENPYTFTVAAPTSLTAMFKAKKYDVTFVNDGVEVQKQNIDFASEIVAPADPTKEGYTFLGWFNGETKYEKGVTVPVDGITYTAKWQINQYTITFDTDGGSEITPVTQDYNSAVTAPANPTKTGYTFTRWEPAIPETVPAKDITVKALWQINQYTITFNTDGGSEIAAITQDYNTTVTAPANPTKTGYTFQGWDKEIPATIPAENMTITAKWQINQYTLTFNTDGGSEIAAITQDYNTTVTAPADPTKTGYTFKGWDKEIPTTIPAENMTITAKWQINQYTLTFDSNGGSEVASVTQDYGTALTVTAPTKTGYTFVGWEPALPETVPAENVTYTAKWQINQYTITFDTNGGEAMAPVKFDYNAEVTVDNPVREGYTFTGWDPALPETMPAENLETKATWTINTYKVTFVSEGKTVKEQTLEYGTQVDLTFRPAEREDYRFVGWDASELNDGKVPAKDVTITAQWKRNECTITFDSNGGSKVDSQTLDCGLEITVPENPTREGYTFIGWEPAIPEIMPEVDITVVAQWQVNQYTITFNSNGGSEVEAMSVDYGSAINAPEATREGYTFAGWDPELPATMPAYDIEVSAQWTINQYTITFIVDGKVVKTTTQDYATEIVAPANPTKEGYTFAGWSPDFKKGATVPAKDVTYTAQWNVNTYFIFFNTNGGSSVQPIMLPYGSAIETPADPEREGYTFAGWDKEIPETMPANNMTINAKWTINTYVINYYIDDVLVYTDKVEYGAAVTPYVPQVEAGKQFDGWQEEIPAVMPATDLDIHGTTSTVTAIARIVEQAGGKADVYTINGVLVMRNADMRQIEQLHSGMYIINGVKVIK